MAIPKRTLECTCDIDTGTLILDESAPAYTGESYALDVTVALKRGDTAYSPSGVLAEMYLYWRGTENMSVAVAMEISGGTLSGTLPDTLTAFPGTPLLVIQLTDEVTGDLIVAAAAPIRITKVRGDLVVEARAPSPSEVIYTGRAPYVGQDGRWHEWDTGARDYVDTGITAKGDTGDAAGFGTPTASVDANVGTPSVTVAASGPDTAKIFAFQFTNLKGVKGDTGDAAGFGTPTASVDANVGTPSVTVTASGPDTAKVFDFAFRNMKGEKGDTGPTKTVNGQQPDANGNVTITDQHVTSTAISGQATVYAALGYLDDWLTSLGLSVVDGKLCQTYEG